jgi:MSHA biogenesis protein MshQ
MKRMAQLFTRLLMLILAFGWSDAAFAANQSITFSALANQTIGAAPFTISATASSGLAVIFTSATSAVCTVSGTTGSTVTLVTTGTCTINANQSGGTNNGTTYSAATQVAQSFTVLKSQTITFNAIPSQNLGFSLTISASASSALAVTFTSATTSVCTVSASTVTLVTTGTCTINANQSGNTSYGAAPQVSQSFAVVPFCTAPTNIPAGVTVSCVCDNFQRTTLNPSTIYGANWIVSTSDQTGILPSIVNQGYLQLTANTGNNAKAATVPGVFPASGNYISVEFQQYAYNGNGADGMAVTLSDYSVPAVPGAFGGSLGYAQKTGTACNTASCPGFAGGWIGVALDEYGNYQNPTEGRIGGPGSVSESVGLRGSGSGVNGYNYLSGTSSLTPKIDDSSSTTPNYGYYYQVVVDARNDPTSTAISVNRNTGAGYSSLISVPNVYTAATAQGFTQAAVPANWQISFTGSTGGSDNIHSIGGLRICAQTVEPPSGGTAGSFNAIDSAYGNASVSPGVAVQNYLTGHIYMKVAGLTFPLNVAALNNSQILTTYAISSAKTVTVRLVDNSDSISNSALDCTLSCTSTCTAKSTITDTVPTQALAFATGATNKGQQQTGNFTLNKAWQKLVAIISDGTTTACSTDAFSVRPPAFTVSAATTAAPVLPLAVDTSGPTGSPTVPAGPGAPSTAANNFTVNANTGVVNYTNTPAINLSNGTDFISGNTLANYLSGTFNSASISTGNASGTFQYADVGYFVFNANTVYDSTWSTVDQGTKNDCDANSVSNTIDASGKYGCNIGSNALTGGRFIPDHFNTIVIPAICQVPACTAANGQFTYSGEPFSTEVIAENYANAPTVNYSAASGYSKAVTLTAESSSTNTSQNPGPGALSSSAVAASAFTAGTAFVTPSYKFSTIKTTPTTIWMDAVDTDAVNSLRAVAGLTVEGQTLIESGQTTILNAYGSATAPLPMTVWLQYWNGSNWALVTNDGVTTFNSNIYNASTAPAGNITASAYTNASMSVSTSSPSTSLGFYNSASSANGQAVFVLGPPGLNGSVNLNLNTASWLPLPWLPSVTGRATFGVYAGSPQLIYLREVY